MPRKLPTDDADADTYIQYRGPQTSVTHDPTGIRFETQHHNGMVAHKPVPVVDDDADDVPPDAVIRSVAQQLVESNPLVAWGVACERCGDVFDSPQARNSHLPVHGADDPDADGSDTGDGGA